MSGSKQYIEMQRAWYEQAAGRSSYDAEAKLDAVVGSYDAHNDWPDYDRFLMQGVDDSYKNKVALDFACGPGRNIVKYADRFSRIDGADIAQANLDNAKTNLGHHGIETPNLFLTDGRSCGDAANDTYDMVFSTIALQHICVHEVRYAIFEDMYRILKPGGRISIQMGFGWSDGKASYYDNHYEATTTNSGHDTMVENTDFLEDDLNKIGFVNFQCWIRPPVPGDSHPYAIFFMAVK
ncbi:class I SAM-dependent methyltransferase [Brevundimonas sp.]|uniref:class I SAM-dependent methyltransferase n=1 Tax=Brevundimonas sp. TaxID=1871086 RepID=UPI003D147A82